MDNISLELKKIVENDGIYLRIYVKLTQGTI